jgi:hypothetical protein
VPEALSGAGSAGREGWAYVMLVCSILYRAIICEQLKQKGTYSGADCVYEHKEKFGLHEQTRATVLSRGAQADARGATQVLNSGGQAVTRDSFCHRYLLLVPLPAAPFLARRRYLIVVSASSAQRQGTPRGDVLSKSWRLCRSLAAQTHVLAVVAPPAPSEI